jgi:hypothetical protein
MLQTQNILTGIPQRWKPAKERNKGEEGKRKHSYGHVSNGSHLGQSMAVRSKT